MSGQETGGLRERFRAVLASSDQAGVLDKLMAAAGYGTHRCVRCGQPQAQEDDTCPPCDREIYLEAIRALRAEIDAKDGQIAEQQAEIERLKTPFEVTIGWPEMSDEELAALERELKAALKKPQKLIVQPENWRQRAEQAEAERDRLRAAVQRVRRLIDKGPSRQCGGQRYILANLISAALDQSDTSTPQQAADDTDASSTPPSSASTNTSGTPTASPTSTRTPARSPAANRTTCSPPARHPSRRTTREQTPAAH